MVMVLMRYFWMIAVCIALWGCRQQETLHQTQSFVFGTMVDITIDGKDERHAEEVSNEILRDFQSIHNQFHAWRPSDLTRLNRKLRLGESAKVDEAMLTMLQEMTKLSVQSDYLFNPAIGELVQAWGFQRDNFEPNMPAADEVLTIAAKKPLMTDIVLEGGLVRSQNAAVQLDLGGYAKGYALDRALEYMQKMRVQHGLVNIGGNIIALGRHGSKPWRVGIQHPRKPGVLATLNLPSGWAIGTSGDYQRYFEFAGKRYCHIIDPRTGYPVQHTQAVTVLIPPGKHAGVLSDVISKPIFIAEPEQKQAMAKKMGAVYYLWIDAQGQVNVSAPMAKLLHWEDADLAKRAHVLAAS